MPATITQEINIDFPPALITQLIQNFLENEGYDTTNIKVRYKVKPETSNDPRERYSTYAFDTATATIIKTSTLVSKPLANITFPEGVRSAPANLLSDNFVER